MNGMKELNQTQTIKLYKIFFLSELSTKNLPVPFALFFFKFFSGIFANNRNNLFVVIILTLGAWNFHLSYAYSHNATWKLIENGQTPLFTLWTWYSWHETGKSIFCHTFLLAIEGFINHPLRSSDAHEPNTPCWFMNQRKAADPSLLSPKYCQSVNVGYWVSLCRLSLVYMILSKRPDVKLKNMRELWKSCRGGARTIWHNAFYVN